MDPGVGADEHDLAALNLGQLHRSDRELVQTTTPFAHRISRSHDFGTAIQTWGIGTASELHDAVVNALRARGTPTLWMYADNGRGRRFYEKHGWQASGRTATGTFPPYAELLEYCL